MMLTHESLPLFGRPGGAAYLNDIERRLASYFERVRCRPAGIPEDWSFATKP